jgi:Ca-activated chloride channel family protein
MTVNVSGDAVAFNCSINQVDKSACPNIQLFVSVTDSHDDPVTAMIQNDFSIYEDGLAQTIVNLSKVPVAAPISVAIALDCSGSTQPIIADVESAAKSFLDLLDLNNDTDEAEIIKFAEDIETKQPFTDDKNLLLIGIDDNYTGGTGETHLYDTLWQAIDSASVSATNDRRAVVVVTDGFDEGSVNHQLSDVVEKANESGVPVFTIGLGNAYISILQQLADETGGQYYFVPNSSDLESIYQSILNLLTNQYIVEYVSPSSGGETIDVDVEIDQGGLKGNDSKSVTGCF